MGVGGSIYKFGMAPAMGEPPDQFRRNEPRCPLTSALTPRSRRSSFSVQNRSASPVEPWMMSFGHAVNVIGQLRLTGGYPAEY